MQRCALYFMNLHLPKKYLSYSAISLWKRDKNLFRKKYYLNERLPDTRYTLFGKEIHKKLETTDELRHIPRFSKSEIGIKVTVEGIPVLGYLDGFAPRRRSFLDYKTGIRKPDGTARWTQAEVDKTVQLPFYSFLIKEKYGMVFPICKLIWLETKWKTITVQVGSRMMEGEGNELELTGYFKLFKREITDEDRGEIRKLIITSAKEISKDYTHWLKDNYHD